ASAKPRRAPRERPWRPPRAGWTRRRSPRRALPDVGPCLLLLPFSLAWTGPEARAARLPEPYGRPETPPPPSSHHEFRPPPPPRAVQRVFDERRSALRHLPGIVHQGETLLADQHDRAVLVQRQDADGEILEADHAVARSNPCRRPGFVLDQLDPGVVETGPAL